MLPAAMSMPAWLLVGGFWLFWSIRSYRTMPELLRLSVVSPDVGGRGLFIQAQGEYLRGNWFEAESLLKRLIQESGRDVEAHLLLATLYRRTRRYDEALARLDSLEQFDQATRWQWEIASERRLIQTGLVQH
jgi:thioredoxin-like negative regulator of GroEL